MEEECIKRLYELMKRSASDLGLSRIRSLDAALGRPSHAFTTIHVAGTNGKGSVSTKIASALTDLGFKTGLYTSPHIATFRERIQVDRKMIPIEQAYPLLKEVSALSPTIPFFEVLTLMAFLYFRSQGVSYAVIEAGLGGTHDATNIIDPILSVITSVSFDHMHILGNTLDEIAANKAGIIKRKTPVLLGHRAALPQMFDKAIEEEAAVYVMPPISDWMEENTQIAKRALEIILPGHKEVDLSIFPPCRFEKVVLENGVVAIFDIAHNIDGLEKLFSRIEQVFPGRGLSLVFGMSGDKDVEGAAKLIRANTDHIFCIDTENPRLFRKRELEERVGVKKGVQFVDFLEEVKERGTILVVTGSAYIMKGMKEALLSPLHSG